MAKSDYKKASEAIDTPTGAILATRPGYELRGGGKLFRTGEHGFFVGYVMDPENIDIAIDEHEEEVRVLMAYAELEFGA
jgi:hypothetical protein